MVLHIGLRDLNHNPELTKALGNMVVAWANVETFLLGLFHTISGVPLPMAQSAYYRVPTFAARTKVGAMLAEWDPSDHDASAISKIIDKLSKLDTAHNKCIHGAWRMEYRRTSPETFT